MSLVVAERRPKNLRAGTGAMTALDSTALARKMAMGNRCMTKSSEEKTLVEDFNMLMTVNVVRT